MFNVFDELKKACDLCSSNFDVYKENNDLEMMKFSNDIQRVILDLMGKINEKIKEKIGEVK